MDEFNWTDWLKRKAQMVDELRSDIKAIDDEQFGDMNDKAATARMRTAFVSAVESIERTMSNVKALNPNA
jgi:hypothetical protein